MNITLTPDIERALVEQAQQHGTTPEELALEYLRERLVEGPAPGLADEAYVSLADQLAEHIGVLSSSEYRSGGAGMSKDPGKKFGAGLIKKRQQGRL